MKRHLTPDEIHDITDAVLNEYTTIYSLPSNMFLKFESSFTQMLHSSLTKVQIYPEGIEELKSKIVSKYRLVNPAKSVGIICGQSIGELNTQSTLNTFHATGIANRTVVQGVPRFLEIIDTNRSETQGAPFANIYIKAPIHNIQQLRDIVGSTLVYHNFGNLYTKHVIYFEDTKELEDWYPSDFIPNKIRIKYFMNLELLYRYRITLEDISLKISNINNITAIFSPLFLGQIDVWCVADTMSVLEDQIHLQILQTKICGIERIQNMFFIKQQNEWYIQTDGSNLEEIMNLPFIDSYKTYSNDIWEMYNLFGIEAVRTYIVEELTNLMPSIHSSHITLLADRMTVSGKLKSISRYTRKHENSSILSKATFEETLSGFLRSALLREEDLVNGASASIICGKVPRVGTGMNELVLY